MCDFSPDSISRTRKKAHVEVTVLYRFYRPVRVDANWAFGIEDW